MAGAIIIASAIGILLLVLVGYVLVGSSLASAGSIASAQKDIALEKEEQLGTMVTISDAHYHGAPDWRLDVRVQNTGNHIIHDITQMDVMLTWGSNAPSLYKYGSGAIGSGTWYYDGWLDRDISMTPEIINPAQWDPGEHLWFQVGLNSKPDQVSAILANGVIAPTANII